MRGFDRNAVWRDVRRREELLRRHDELNDAAKFLRSYGLEMKVSVRFAASAVGGHDKACAVVAEILQGRDGDAEDRRNRLVAQIEQEMLDIEDQLA